jgi:hypothetical protein
VYGFGGDYTAALPPPAVCGAHPSFGGSGTSVRHRRAHAFPAADPPASLSFCRVHAHAASALINFCEGVERDTLLPYLDPIVARLLKLLNPPGDPAAVRRYVQEQAITTLAMVADASEATFAKVRVLRCVLFTVFWV